MEKYFEIALNYYGLKEIDGTKSNPTILGWIRKYLTKENDDSAISWCAIFVNKCLEEAGKIGTGKVNARSFLEIGQIVLTPKIGDIVILWRESNTSWKGHVGFYVTDNEDSIYVLGGNQSNAVNISAYPKYRLLGYRRV